MKKLILLLSILTIVVVPFLYGAEQPKPTEAPMSLNDMREALGVTEPMSMNQVRTLMEARKAESAIVGAGPINSVVRTRIMMDLIYDGAVTTPANYADNKVDYIGAATAIKYADAFCLYFGGPINGTNAEKARFYINHMRSYHKTILTHFRKQTGENTAAAEAAVETEADLGADETVMSNEAPTDVVLTNTVTTLPDDTDLSERLKVADIVVTDDEQGVNELSLSGDDASMFEISGTELYLKAESTLDSVANPVLDVTVAVDDTSVGSTPDDTTALSITITAA